MRGAFSVLIMIAVTFLCGGCGGKALYRPGATQADFEHDKAQCDYEATKYSYTPMGAFDSPIKSGMQEGMQYNKLMDACMRSKGWRPVQQ